MDDWYGLLRDGELIAVRRGFGDGFAPSPMDFGVSLSIPQYEYEVRPVRIEVED